MKRIILLMLAGILIASPAFSVDDDSTPYMPFPETPPQNQSSKTPAKKSAPKKQTPAKKPAPKKQTPKKTAKPKAPARPSSLQQGIALMQQDRYEQARPYLLKAIQENRNDPNAWYWYGVYHEKTGGFHQAQYFYSKAVTIDPAFEPLSRVVYYPEDSEKTPLWDPKRPARVYPVEVASTKGIKNVPAGIPGRSSFPEAPNDPELPHVPVYTPPEPGAAPFDGDAWSPAVYVPPSPEEINTEGEMSAVYLPPEPESIIAQTPNTTRQVLELPVYRYPEGYEAEQPQAVRRDEIVRADKPLYNPPNPGEKAPQSPKKSAPKTQTVKKQSTTAKTQEVSTQRKASVPDNRIVRQTQKPKKTSAKSAPAAASTKTQTTRKSSAVSRDVKPKTPAKQSGRSTTQKSNTPAPKSTPPQPKRAPEPITLPPEPETQRNERPKSPQYMPPVGQSNPDPGTISDAPMPPVGQGSNY